MGIWSFLFGKPAQYTPSSALPALASGSGGLLRQPNVLTIKLGDVVGYEGIDYVVRNRYTFNSHGFKWFSYHLVDVISNDKLWLDAEDDDALEVGISRSIDLDIPDPIPKEVVWDGERYYQDEHGMANVYIESEASSPKHSNVEYWDYANAAETKFLCIERWDGEYEASISEPIQPYQLTILPGESHA